MTTHRPMTDVPGITLHSAEVFRNGARVLGPLSLRLQARRVGIVGRNGSGKSSLLRLLAGLSHADAGQVRVCGIDPAADRAAAIRTLGILFQNPDHQIIFPTVAEELAFGLEQIGLDRAKAQASAAEVLARHGRDDWAERQVQTLSEGQRRWLCLMAVLAMAPQVLLLDEPFAGLDIPTIMGLQATFARLPQTLVTVAHDPAHLQGCDQLVWLEAGCLAMVGSPDTVLPAYLAEMHRQGAAEGPC